MLDTGLSEAGAAQALGWRKARVTARRRLLELPETAQQMVGDGRVALSCVEQLLAIGRVSGPLLDAVISYLADGNESASDRLARQPGWVLDAAVRASDSKVFAESLASVNGYELERLKLGKKAEALLERAAELSKALDRYSYGLEVRFSEQEIDQARAAGVLIEFEHSHAAPVIVDRSVYRELCKQALTRTVAELEQRVTERKAERAASRKTARSGGAVDPVVEANRAQRARLRELAADAHGVNLDLGSSLITGLSTVDPADPRVARFFVYGLLGEDAGVSSYSQAGERICELAVTGIRLVIDQFRSDVTKTLKDGRRGKLRIAYGDPHQPEDAVAWTWKFIDGGARSAGELYGRALVVIAAQQYASRLVVPQSQRHHPLGWGSHNDNAAKALKKLAGPHLPASLTALERAVNQAHAQQQKAAEAAQAGSQPDDGDADCAGNVEDDHGEQCHDDADEQEHELDEGVPGGAAVS